MEQNRQRMCLPVQEKQGQLFCISLANSQSSRVPCLFAYQCSWVWQMPIQLEGGGLDACQEVCGLDATAGLHSLVGRKNTKAFNNPNVPLLQESGAKQHLMRDCFVPKSSTSSGLVSSLTWLQQIKKAHSEDSHDSLLNCVRALLLSLGGSINKQQHKHHKARQFSDCSAKVSSPLGIRAFPEDRPDVREMFHFYSVVAWCSAIFFSVTSFVARKTVLRKKRMPLPLLSMKN